MISQKTKLAKRSATRSRAGTASRDCSTMGRIEIDSNTVERSMRPIALNRKNALFAGSEGGTQRWQSSLR
ncbi:MAG: hypothetical protein E5W25_01100 [Mesorhizobium sp.]|nr:MAG: hypothetical protein E5W25_01100 [Mesorhizobium sp.]